MTGRGKKTPENSTKIVFWSFSTDSLCENIINKENIMGIITDILKEIPLSAVLREKIVDLETKMSALEAENLVLKKENSDLNSLVVNLRQEIQRRDDIFQNKKPHDNLPKNRMKRKNYL
jgi:hypothetical protein